MVANELFITSYFPFIWYFTGAKRLLEYYRENFIRVDFSIFRNLDLILSIPEAEDSFKESINLPISMGSIKTSGLVGNDACLSDGFAPVNRSKKIQQNSR